MTARNLYLAIKSQMPLKRLLINFFITGNAWRLFFINSHVNQKTGEPKVQYSSIEKALRSAQKMQEKYGESFSAYKCVFCDGYHIDKNQVADENE